MFCKRARICLIVKDLTFSNMHKSAQEYETTGFVFATGGTKNTQRGWESVPKRLLEFCIGVKGKRLREKQFVRQ